MLIQGMDGIEIPKGYAGWREVTFFEAGMERAAGLAVHP
jgi:hypothetical protein